MLYHIVRTFFDELSQSQLALYLGRVCQVRILAKHGAQLRNKMECRIGIVPT